MDANEVGGKTAALLSLPSIKGALPTLAWACCQTQTIWTHAYASVSMAPHDTAAAPLGYCSPVPIALFVSLFFTLGL